MNHRTARSHAARPNVLPFPTEQTIAEAPRPSPEPVTAETIAALESRLGAAIARTGLAVEDLALSLDERRTAPPPDRHDQTTAILVAIAIAIVALIPDPTARLAVAMTVVVAIVAERAVRAASSRLMLGGPHAR